MGLKSYKTCYFLSGECGNRLDTKKVSCKTYRKFKRLIKPMCLQRYLTEHSFVWIRKNAPLFNKAE